MKFILHIVFVIAAFLLVSSSTLAVVPQTKEQSDARKKSATHVVVGKIGTVYESASMNRSSESIAKYHKLVVSFDIEKVERDNSTSLKQGARIYFHDSYLENIAGKAAGNASAGPWAYQSMKEWNLRMYLKRDENGVYRYLEFEVLKRTELKEDSIKADTNEIQSELDRIVGLTIQIDEIRNAIEKIGKKDKLGPLSGDKARRTLVVQLFRMREKLQKERDAVWELARRLR